MTVTRGAKATPNALYIVSKVEKKLIEKLPIVKKTIRVGLPNKSTSLAVKRPKLVLYAAEAKIVIAEISKYEKLGKKLADDGASSNPEILKKAAKVVKEVKLVKGVKKVQGVKGVKEVKEVKAVKQVKIVNVVVDNAPKIKNPTPAAIKKEMELGLAKFKLKKSKDPTLTAAAQKKIESEKSEKKKLSYFHKLITPKGSSSIHVRKNDTQNPMILEKQRQLDKQKPAPVPVPTRAESKKLSKAKPTAVKPTTVKLTAAELKKHATELKKKEKQEKLEKLDSKIVTSKKAVKIIPLTAAALKKLEKLQLAAAALKKQQKNAIPIILKKGQKEVVVVAQKQQKGQQKGAGLKRAGLKGAALKSKKKPLSAAELKKLAKLKKLKALIPKKPTVKKPKEWDCKGSDWSGNSDDEGSVDFALLDEDLCYECGLDTSDVANWENLIICDSCDGEYHMACVKLDRIPRNGYTCPRCNKEDQELRKLAFTVSNHFEIPKKKRGQIINRCYSPSRPLEVAFEECKRKGFMLVSRLFTYELIRQLTHGFFQKLTSSGRVADCWEGATSEISKRLGKSSHNLVDRQGRFDLTLPEFVVDQLKLKDVLEPLLSLLRSIMCVGKKKPELRTHNIVFVPVGSQEQIWHVDDCVRNKGMAQRYFTVLIQLNSIDENCGGTEVWSKELCRGDLIRGRPGDAFVFPGSLLHRGRGNDGHSHRFFYYASFSSETDNNE